MRSLDRDDVDGRARRVRHLQRRRDIQEVPLAVLVAVGRQLLEVAYLIEGDAEIAHQRAMQRYLHADRGIELTLVADRIRAERRDLHLVEPVDELWAVGEARLVEVLVELLLGLLEPKLKEADAKAEDIVLFDRHALLLGGSVNILEAEKIALVESELALVGRHVEQDAATYDAFLRDRKDGSLGHAADCRRRGISVPDLVVVPDVPKRVVLRRALKKHRHLVVSVLDAARKRLNPAGVVVALVPNVDPRCRGAARPNRIARQLTDLFAAGEDFALFHRANAPQHFGTGQEVQRADLIVGTPAAPVRGRAGKQLTHSQLFAFVQRPGGSHARFTPHSLCVLDRSGDETLAQIALEHLAVGVSGQRVLETMKGFRNLVVRELFRAVAGELFVRDRLAQNDEGMDALAEDRAGLCNDCRFHHRRMVEQNILDFGGEDFESAAVDDVLDPVDDPQVALLVHDPEIAR